MTDKANQAAEQEPKEVKERETYTLDDGIEGSRSAYIRQEFKKDKSRGEIAKELEVPYYIVYSATANMFNAQHQEGESGSVGRGIIMEDGRSRAEHMREMYRDGTPRGEIAKHFEVPYSTVYAATKDEDAPEGARQGGKVMITLEDGSEVARVEYIRELYADGEGMTRREIADKLSCDYAVVWAATKEDKKEDEADVAGKADAEVAATEDEVPDLEEDDQ